MADCDEPEAHGNRRRMFRRQLLPVACTGLALGLYVADRDWPDNWAASRRH